MTADTYYVLAPIFILPRARLGFNYRNLIYKWISSLSIWGCIKAPIHDNNWKSLLGELIELIDDGVHLINLTRMEITLLNHNN